MKYSAIVLLLGLLLSSCQTKNRKVSMIVYPEYCRGCVVGNFDAIRQEKAVQDFIIYFDTTDAFILELAVANRLLYQHVKNSEIPARFGDYANLLVLAPGKPPVELRTNEIIQSGVHF